MKPHVEHPTHTLKARPGKPVIAVACSQCRRIAFFDTEEYALDGVAVHRGQCRGSDPVMTELLSKPPN